MSLMERVPHHAWGSAPAVGASRRSMRKGWLGGTAAVLLALLLSQPVRAHAQSLDVALVCGTSGCADVDRDVPIRNHLTTTLGHTVTNFDDNDQTWIPTSFDVVVISESVLSSNIAWLKDQAVSIFTVAGTNWDELEMGSGGSSSGGGDTDIKPDNSHYITGVFSNAVRTVTTVATNLGDMSGWANGVRKLAHYKSNSTLAKLLYVEAGGVLQGGVNTAAERRVFFGVQYFANLTADGITLFNRSLNWAAHNTADHMVVTATDGTATAGGTEVLTLQLVDDLGNPVSSALAVTVTVTGSATFSANDIGGTNGSNTLTGTLSAGGSGTVTITNNVAETVTVSADATGDAQAVANVDASVLFTPGPASAATSTITASPTSITADGVSASTITVQLKDANGADLTTGGDVATLSTTLGSLSPVTDNGDGSYTARLTSIAGGRAIVTGTVNGNLIADDAAVDFGVGKPAALVFTVQPSDVIAGGTIVPAAQVRVVDAGGNVVEAFAGTVTLSIEDNPVGGGLDGTTSVVPTLGVAAFSDLSIDKPGAGYTLRATAGTLAAISEAFDVLADEADLEVNMTVALPRPAPATRSCTR